MLYLESIHECKKNFAFFKREEVKGEEAKREDEKREERSKREKREGRRGAGVKEKCSVLEVRSRRLREKESWPKKVLLPHKRISSSFKREKRRDIESLLVHTRNFSLMRVRGREGERE